MTRRRLAWSLITHTTGGCALLVVAVVLYAATALPGANSITCSTISPSFDGTEPLRYAEVTGASEERANFTRQVPAVCNTGAEHCDGSGLRYLLPGDTVAVAYTCGRFAYAQYIGKETVSTGWIDERRLHYKEAKLPFNDGGPPPSMRHFEPGRIHMTLMRGRGTPVCEAYLQRLNSTVFYAPPYCGRPDNDQIPGFIQLNRTELSRDQIKSLWGQVYALTVPGYLPPWMPVPAEDLANIARGPPAGNFLGAWRFESPVDIDNSRNPLNIVMWNGRPADMSRWSFLPCGMPHDAVRESTVATGHHTVQIAFVASSDYMQINTGETRAAFGPTSVKLPASSTSAPREWDHRMLGNSIGIFEYRDRYYIDTFLWNASGANVEKKRPTMSSLSNHLAVVLRENGKAREMCEYAYDPDRSLKPISPAR